ncbi:S8 family peptidase [Sporosarcina obsidiansis]|uniref:S8 family peptidase n=1 Tax=Sporosarcina obsidiansis TaxID=2660748 RepID=UPI00129B4CA9|nr:S8 family peptidase [Sporosarcina obsidiansis]
MYEHLSLPRYKESLEKRKNTNRGGGYSFPQGRIKTDYYSDVNTKAINITKSYQELKEKFNGKINPNLIYRINVNQSVGIENFEKSLNAMGGISVLSIAENRQGYWVVFSNDENFTSFKDKLEQYSGIKEGNKYDFFNAIDSVEDIPVEEKIGPYLTKIPMEEGEVDYLDLELWKLEDKVLRKFIEELKTTYPKWDEFRICDELITTSFALFRIKVSFEIAKEIVGLKEVARLDRPFIPTFKLTEYSGIDVGDLDIKAPSDDATGILVIDSGITSNHPLLEKAVGNEENFQESEKELQDKVGHGTAVGGLAIYGDIKERVNQKQFDPSNWLFSAKVMYAEEDFSGNIRAVYDKEKLLENQLYDAIRTFLENDMYKIKVVNLSIGDSTEFLKSKNNRQFPLAALLDEMALVYKDVVFVVSSGNSSPWDVFDSIDELVENYPNYLVTENSFRIINPATSALSITVGSIASEGRLQEQSMDVHLSDIWTTIAKEDEPSPFTRVGFGINNMIKPEVVHYGGNLILRDNYGRIVENNGGKLPLLSNNPIKKLFTYDIGTSFSAPLVTNIIGKIANDFPDKSANFIKNIFLQSTNSSKINGLKGSDSEIAKSSIKMQGYGLPSYERAVASFDNRVVLLDETSLGLNKVHIYTLELPDMFFETKGNKRISVALTFDPITRMTRGDSYLGNQMQFKLYHTLSPDLITNKYAEIDISDENQIVDAIDDKYEIKLLPGPDLRKKGCHQKGIKEYLREPKKAPDTPITLVVVNSNKWIPDINYEQSYCVSVSIEHTADIQLYSKVRSMIQPKIRIR